LTGDPGLYKSIITGIPSAACFYRRNRRGPFYVQNLLEKQQISGIFREENPV
jgi:hypothetical protein